ncbi:MAG: hypothetical protein KC457_24850, partial [Myxococcales bacterium]|nr:hypothetical protein [Myxococcales bacterium]
MTAKSSIIVVAGALALVACGGNEGRDDNGTGLTLGTADDVDSVGTDTAESGTTDGGGCMEGSACEGGVCVAGACCPTNQACGSICCGGTEVCSFGQCVVPGSACESSEDCDVDEYCEFSLGGEGQPPDPGCIGGEILSGQCLPQPPICEGGEPLGPGGLPTCVEACDVPPGEDFDIAVAYEIEGPGYTAPIVVQLDDDDCDGLVTARDVPEIIWNMHTGADYGDPTNGRIKAVSIVEDQVVEKFIY